MKTAPVTLATRNTLIAWHALWAPVHRVRVDILSIVDNVQCAIANSVTVLCVLRQAAFLVQLVILLKMEPVMSALQGSAIVLNVAPQLARHVKLDFMSMLEPVQTVQ